MSIHPTAIISAQAELASDVEVGPYCVIGAGVKIGSGTVLKSHVVIDGITEIGQGNVLYPFAAIGGQTQDLKYAGEPTSLVIGDRNTFRENVTVHRSTSQTEPTRIGSDNNFLAYSHVAHDCIVGDHCIFSNNGTIAGHVVVQDYAIISGFAAVHQFCRVGRHSIIGGCAKIVQDVTPFMIVDGTPAEVRGINTIGLQRRGFTPEQIREVKTAYKALFLKKKGTNLSDSLSQLAQATGLTAEVRDFITSSERGIVR